MRKRQIKVAGDIILGMVERTHFAYLRSIILLLVILMSSVSAYAYVKGEYFVKDHITYRVIDASTASPKLAVYNVKGISGTVTIPGTVFDGKDVNFKVTQIGGGIDNDPIRWDDTVTRVILPNTITTLSNYCFAFSSITSLTLPASVTTIGPWANVLFGRCYKLKEILVDAGNSSFISDNGVLYTKGHKELICVPFNKDLSSTGNCFTINSNTKKIRVDAMGDNPTLQKLVVPASVSDMYMERWPTFAFNPTALKEIDVDANNATYCSIDGVVYS
ncbi:MAG: leucine-rich repeat protein, partial [Prevotella sp.]